MKPRKSRGAIMVSMVATPAGRKHKKTAGNAPTGKRSTALTKTILTPEIGPKEASRKHHDTVPLSNTSGKRMGIGADDSGDELAKRLKTDIGSAARRAALSPSLPQKQHTLTGLFMRPKPAGMRKQLGMVNLGNTCYMNAVVQAVLGLRPFVRDIESPPFKALEVPTDGVAAALQQCILARRASDKNNDETPINLASLKAAMERYANFCHGTLQQDAHEFLCMLLQRMQEEVLQAESTRSQTHPTPAKVTPIMQEERSEPGGSGKTMQSTAGVIKLSETACPVARNFEFSLVRVLTCSACGHHTETTERFTHLSLELPPSETEPCDVPAMLVAFMEGEDVSKSCERCRGSDSIPHRMHHRVARLPQVLALHLKRLKVDSEDAGVPRLSKLHTRVKQAQSLSMSPWCDDSTLPPIACTQDPTAWRQVTAAAEEDKENLHRGVATRPPPKVARTVAELLSASAKGKLLPSMPPSSLDFSLPPAFPRAKPRTPCTPQDHRQSDRTPMLFSLGRGNMGCHPTVDREDAEIQEALLASMADTARASDGIGDKEGADIRRALALSLQEAGRADDACVTTPETQPSRPRLSAPLHVVDDSLEDSARQGACERLSGDAGAMMANAAVAVPMPSRSGATSHRYVLRSCISHKGEQAAEGHFIADVQGRSGWTRYDDSHVSTLSGGETLPPCHRRERESYLLFYTLQDTVQHGGRRDMNSGPSANARASVMAQSKPGARPAHARSNWR